VTLIEPVPPVVALDVMVRLASRAAFSCSSESGVGFSGSGRIGLVVMGSPGKKVNEDQELETQNLIDLEQGPRLVRFAQETNGIFRSFLIP